MSPGLAMDAVILLRLQARAGHWVGVHDLAEHLRTADAVVVQRVEQLALPHLLQLRYGAGLLQAVAAPHLNELRREVLPCA